MAHLRLGTVSFVTSPERDRLAALRCKYMEVGLRYRTKFLSGYSAIKSADELFQNFPDELAAALSETVNMAASDIAANRVYDVDLSTIRADLEERVASVRSGFDRVQNQYFDILGKAAELEAQRQEAAANRGRLVGGGFGVEGAARGIAMATVANAAIGLTYGLANLTGKAASALGDSKKKRELLEDPTTNIAVADFLCRAVLQGYKLVAETVNKSSGTRVFDVVPVDDRQKSSAMVENVTSGRVPEPERPFVLAQALELDPFNEGAWRLWIDRFGDDDGIIEASAKAVWVKAVEAQKAKLMTERRAALAWSTPDECENSGPALEQLAIRLGVPFEPERARIERTVRKLDRASRTVDGFVYPTVAAAKAAELAAQTAREDVLRRTFDGVVYATVDEADGARNDRATASRANTTLGWMTLGYRRFRQTKGRSSTEEFWLFLLFYGLAVVALAIAQIAVPVQFAWIPSLGAALLTAFSIVAGLTLQIRRCHDLNLTGWVALLNLLFGVGNILMLGLMLLQGTVGDNKYGPDPVKR